MQLLAVELAERSQNREFFQRGEKLFIQVSTPSVPSAPSVASAVMDLEAIKPSLLGSENKHESC
jgi:hypothetical protein